jgi:hypothetical protein
MNSLTQFSAPVSQQISSFGGPDNMNQGSNSFKSFNTQQSLPLTNNMNNLENMGGASLTFPAYGSLHLSVYHFALPPPFLLAILYRLS